MCAKGNFILCSLYYKVQIRDIHSAGLGFSKKNLQFPHIWEISSHCLFQQENPILYKSCFQPLKLLHHLFLTHNLYKISSLSKCNQKNMSQETNSVFTESPSKQEMDSTGLVKLSFLTFLAPVSLILSVQIYEISILSISTLLDFKLSVIHSLGEQNAIQGTDF